jgi:hypothetical protein
MRACAHLERPLEHGVELMHSCTLLFELRGQMLNLRGLGLVCLLVFAAR